MRTPWYMRLMVAAFRAINRRRVWYRLPFPLAVLNLVSIRADMREHNLYDTETSPPTPPRPDGHDVRQFRTFDGSYNDLAKPWMGQVETRFGRNVPIPETHGEKEPALYEPNPRLVSSRLLSRKEFVPATSVNVLLPAWLQFMVHDWLSHGRNVKENPHRFPVPAGDDWNRPEMTILRTRPDPSPLPRGPAGHLPQRVHPLVGRLADLRLRPQAAVPRPQRPGPASLHGGWRRRAARPLGAAARWQALARRAGACCRWTPTRRPPAPPRNTCR